MGDSARGVSINMMTCIGRETLMGHFCTTRENENDQSTKQTDRPKLFTASNELDPLKMTVFVEKHAFMPCMNACMIGGESRARAGRRRGRPNAGRPDAARLFAKD